MSEKREQLLEATIDLFAQEGFWNTSTARIAKHAGVATGTLFNYFDSKETLIDEVYRTLKKEMSDFLLSGFDQEEGSARVQSESLWRRYILWGVQFPIRYSLLGQLHLSNLISKKMVDQVEAELADLFQATITLHQEGLLGNASIDYIMTLIKAELDVATTQAIEQDLHGPELETLITSSINIFWEGIGAS
ncbi:MAG: TetR/AcrR family transcriptional regulator [Verrucomicrobiota bacterium]